MFRRPRHKYLRRTEVTDLKHKVELAAQFIRARSATKPKFGIILGTGLNALAAHIKAEAEIPYSDIPTFPVPTVAHHTGVLHMGTIEGQPIVAMEGRFHYYEGCSMEQITLPVRVMRALGAEILIISAAGGGMNPNHNIGDILIIDDHINFMGVNPLIGPNDEALGPRYPDMCEPYDSSLVALAEKIALRENIRAHRGVYIAVSGPNLETRAEYRMMRTLGADVVGMSTVPEVLVAAHAGLRVIGLVVITDRCLPDALKPTKIEEIIRVANEAEPKLTKLVARIVAEAK
jgi:purine-nucleoside phosphorylase